mgnify:CR=1 FL=1
MEGTARNAHRHHHARTQPKAAQRGPEGEVCAIHSELEGTYVQAGTPLATIRHFLSKDEVLRILLKQALNLFVAPERAKYYFVPQIDTKIKVSGCRSVSVYEGMELFIVSRMKREMPLYYTGPDGLIYTVYFEHNENVDAGSPLIGVTIVVKGTSSAAYRTPTAAIRSRFPTPKRR